MLNRRKINFGFKIVSGTILLGSAITTSTILSSCDNQEILNIGSYDGTDWQGYESGHLFCSLTENGKGAEMWSDGTTNYKAHNLIIPDIIRYPNGVTVPLVTIENMFNRSKNITGTLTLGKNIVFVFGSFNELPNVTGDLVLPNNLHDIYESFSYCGFNKMLFVGDMVEHIDNQCFEQSNFENIVVSKYNFTFGLATNMGEKCCVLVPKNITDGTYLFDWENGNNAVANLIFGELTIPDNVKQIRNDTFADCHGLKGDLIIPDTVESIGQNAFQNCGFDGKLSIGSGLKNIGSNAFGDCNFSTVEVGEGNVNYGLANNVGECKILVAKEENNVALLDYNNQNSIISGIAFGTLEIPDDITNINPFLLKKCYGLKGIKLAESNLSPYKLVRSSPGVGTFTEDISLEHPGFMINKNDILGEENEDMDIKSIVPFSIGELTIPDSLDGHKIVGVGDSSDMEKDGDIAFSDLKIGKLTTGINLTTIYGSAFKDCILSEVNLTNVTTIHESAFEGKTIEEISFPKITSLSVEAFEWQMQIISVTVDASVNPENLIYDEEDNDYGYVLVESYYNEGELIDSSGDGAYREDWRYELMLGYSWKWVN